MKRVNIIKMQLFISLASASCNKVTNMRRHHSATENLDIDVVQNNTASQEHKKCRTCLEKEIMMLTLGLCDMSSGTSLTDVRVVLIFCINLERKMAKLPFSTCAGKLRLQ